jgi:internalin A
MRRLEDNEWEYIAPELLPGWSEAQDALLAGRLLSVPPAAEVEAEYGFLHEGVLRNFLSRIGRRAGDAAIYWRYGCWFYEKTTDSRVLIESAWKDAASETGAGSIRFRAWGVRARELIEPLLRVLEEVPVGERPRLEWRTEEAAGPKRATEIDALEITAEVQPAAGQRAVYISYAWGDDSSPAARDRQKVVEGACEALEGHGWKVVRDVNTLHYGDLITDFMKTITRADRIVVILSEKYLQSTACMTELFGIYQRSNGEKREFLDRIAPLSLTDAKFSGWRDRAAIAKSWRDEFEAMKKVFDDLGASDLALYTAMKDWHNRVGDILAYVSDVLHPRGFEKIAEDDFAALIDMLERGRGATPDD